MLTSVFAYIRDLDETTPATTPSSEVTAASGLISNNGMCCRRYSSTRIPLSRIKGYLIQTTSDWCLINAIIKGRVCADPGAEWVQNHVRSIRMKSVKVHHSEFFFSCNSDLKEKSPRNQMRQFQYLKAGAGSDIEMLVLKGIQVSTSWNIKW
uniref:Chemokine interleukin-8-like domain-containing protein n=1 Tax=Dicentrarchus labrax TaxID=13489 RepID=A0A8P4KS04_DICLA